MFQEDRQAEAAQQGEAEAQAQVGGHAGPDRFDVVGGWLNNADAGNPLFLHRSIDLSLFLALGVLAVLDRAAAPAPAAVC